MRGKPGSSRVLSDVPDDFETVITRAKHAFIVSTLPQTSPMLAAVIDRHSLANQLHRWDERRGFGCAFKKRMKVILHIDVRQNGKLTLGACTHKFMGLADDKRGIKEEFLPALSRTRNEIAVFADVIEGLQSRGTTERHDVGRATPIPVPPPVAPHFSGALEKFRCVV